MLHRVAHKTTCLVLGELWRKTIYRALHHDVASIVRNREVPPEKRRTLNALRNPSHSALGHVATYSITSPEHVDRWVELLAIHHEATTLGRISPKACVLGRTYDEWCHVALNLHEIVVEDVHKLGLVVRVCAVTLDIVEVHSKGTHAKLIHSLELTEQVLNIRLLPLDILAWVHRPHEVHAVAVARLHQLTNLLCLSLGILLTPIWRAVVWVVLRAVDVVVHLVATIGVDKR